MSYDEVKEGLDTILFHHSKGTEQRYPRRIQTSREPRQWKIKSDEEALKKFAKAGNVDCYISLYPIAQEGQTLIPDVIYIDLDNRSKKDFVLERIDHILPGSLPTVLDSGCGLSIILPVNSDEFIKALGPLFHLHPIKKILRFCARELSGGEADSGHNASVNSCMVRVPGTFNSKNTRKVTVLQLWNGYRPSLLPLYRPFLNDLLMGRRQERITAATSGEVEWIEKLLRASTYSGRACAIERIFCPYLIRRMLKEDAISIIKDWLARCLALPNARPMTPSKRYDGYIGYYLDRALRLKKQFSYLKLEILKTEHPDLYNHVMTI